jgi:hypothetical protein
METASGAFDFIYGHWRVHNRKLRDVADPNCEEWAADPDVPVWRQLFSFDRGASWSLNWIMTLTRETS